jgi:hypothetical protein
MTTTRSSFVPRRRWSDRRGAPQARLCPRRGRCAARAVRRRRAVHAGRPLLRGFDHRRRRRHPHRRGAESRHQAREFRGLHRLIDERARSSSLQPAAHVRHLRMSLLTDSALARRPRQEGRARTPAAIRQRKVRANRAVEGMLVRPRTVSGRMVSCRPKSTTATTTPCPHFATVIAISRSPTAVALLAGSLEAALLLLAELHRPPKDA